MVDLSKFNQEMNDILSTLENLIKRTEMAIDFGDKEGVWYPRKFVKRLRGQLLGVYKSVMRERNKK